MSRNKQQKAIFASKFVISMFYACFFCELNRSFFDRRSNLEIFVESISIFIILWKEVQFWVCHKIAIHIAEIIFEQK